MDHLLKMVGLGFTNIISFSGLPTNRMANYLDAAGKSLWPHHRGRLPRFRALGIHSRPNYEPGWLVQHGGGFWRRGFDARSKRARIGIEI